MVANCITCICIKLKKKMFIHASKIPMCSNIGSLKHLYYVNYIAITMILIAM